MLPPILGEYQTPPHDFLCQTSWQLLAVQPPRWPLYAWTPPSSRAQDRSLKVALKPSQSASQQNGPFQTKRHYQRKLWGFLQRFPHDGGVAPEIQSNTNRPRNSLVCRPSGAKKKKNAIKRQKCQEIRFTLILPNLKKSTHGVVILLLDSICNQIVA